MSILSLYLERRGQHSLPLAILHCNALSEHAFVVVLNECCSNTTHDEEFLPKFRVVNDSIFGLPCSTLVLGSDKVCLVSIVRKPWVPRMVNWSALGLPLPKLPLLHVHNKSTIVEMYFDDKCCRPSSSSIYTCVLTMCDSCSPLVPHCA